MAKEQIAWTYENTMIALDQFQEAHSYLPEQKGFLGWSISVGEAPQIKLTVSEIGSVLFLKNIKLPKDFEVQIEGLKSKLKIILEITPLLPSVAPKSGQKPNKQQA